MVLLLDDDPVLLELYSQLLAARDVTFSAFLCPHKALQSFRGAPHLYDAAVLDVFLPGTNTDGLSVAHAIIDMRPDLPILFATGLEDDDNIERLKEVGLYMRKRTHIYIAKGLWRLLEEVG